MRFIVADIETNGLLDELTTIHCLVLRDLETDDVLSCTDSAPAAWYEEKWPDRCSLAEGLLVLSQAERVYWHNGIRFDFPALQKVLGRDPHDPSKMRDTFTIASMRWAHIADSDWQRAKSRQFPGDKRLVGSHSLEAWGYRLGLHKGEYTKWCKEQGIEDVWAVWRPEMQAYCEQDTAVSKALVERIRAAGVSDESVEIEHDLSWYLAQQERNGWPFNLAAAQSLVADLSARRQELTELLIEEFGSWYVSRGTVTPKVGNKTRGITKGCPYTKLELIEFNPGSRDHIAKVLQGRFGWKPESYTDGGKPQVDDDTLKALSEVPAAARLCEYLTINKRLGAISEGKQSWFKFTKKNAETGEVHVHPRVKQNHAVTHRASHVSPPIAGTPKVQVGKDKKPLLGLVGGYGAECRSVWTVPQGWLQVGADASGLELRCLAHYMGRYDGGAYVKVLLEGDIHAANQAAADLPSRDNAKTFIYAFLYGAGDEKIGSIVAPLASPPEQARIGKKLKAQFLKNTPALGLLIEDVKEKAKDCGYLIMPDGRRTYIRHQHAALNSLLQSSGAIICKRWIIDFNRRLVSRFGTQGWQGQWAALGWIHDEVQLAVRPEIAEEVCSILVDTIRALTAHYHFRCPLDGEAKIGRNWRDTH